MNNEHGKLGKLLRDALPPITDAELHRDLWPRMLRRLDERAWRVPWYDWLLAGAPLLWFVLFPEHITIVMSLL